VNRAVSGQQQKPAEVSQQSSNAGLDAVGIPLLWQGGGCQYGKIASTSKQVRIALVVRYPLFTA